MHWEEAGEQLLLSALNDPSARQNVSSPLWDRGLNVDRERVFRKLNAVRDFEIRKKSNQQEHQDTIYRRQCRRMTKCFSIAVYREMASQKK